MVQGVDLFGCALTVAILQVQRLAGHKAVETHGVGQGADDVRLRLGRKGLGTRDRREGLVQ